jgi:alkanesulfonate monooxygenase SsuD/methylene tetrahydromethanopterin reductase-like flavin-dependent oxidoreductase (luciferase family)
MKFGIFQTVPWPEGTDQTQQIRNGLEQSILAEELGFSSLWMTEHHFTRHGITSDNLALLTYIAARTEKIRLGTAVSVLPFHDPVRLAESTAMVDQLSGGRLDVGIGRGYQWSEYEGFGINLDEGSERFEDAVRLLVQSWKAEEPFAFDGKYHSYDRALPLPKPIQRPHPPLWHATTSAAGLRRCAESGWGVLIAQGTPPSAIQGTVELYNEQLADIGGTLNPHQLLVARGMYCAATTEQAFDTFMAPYVATLELAAKVSKPPDDANVQTHRNPFQLDGILRESLVCGDPDDCARYVQQLADMGIEHLMLFVNALTMDHQTVMDSMRLFAAEVIPRFAP